MVPNSPLGINDTSTLGTKDASQGINILQLGKEKCPFDFSQFDKYYRIQISPINYLKYNPIEINRFIDHYRGDNMNLNHNLGSTIKNESLTSNLFEQGEPSILATFPSQKPKPFYVSLYINGSRLKNCIIDLGASNNVMSSPIAKALGLTLPKSHHRCYSMDVKKVPLLG